MAFKQKYSNVARVKNIEDVGITSENENYVSFDQEYKDVLDVINLQYDSKSGDCIQAIIGILNRMSESQMNAFISELNKNSNNPFNQDSEEYKRLAQCMTKRNNKIEAFMEFLKTGGTALTFLTTVLNFAKAIV